MGFLPAAQLQTCKTERRVRFQVSLCVAFETIINTSPDNSVIFLHCCTNILTPVFAPAAYWSAGVLFEAELQSAVQVDFSAAFGELEHVE